MTKDDLKIIIEEMYQHILICPEKLPSCLTCQTIEKIIEKVEMWRAGYEAGKAKSRIH